MTGGPWCLWARAPVGKASAVISRCGSWDIKSEKRRREGVGREEMKGETWKVGAGTRQVHLRIQSHLPVLNPWKCKEVFRLRKAQCQLMVLPQREAPSCSSARCLSLPVSLCPPLSTFHFFVCFGVEDQPDETDFVVSSGWEPLCGYRDWEWCLHINPRNWVSFPTHGTILNRGVVIFVSLRSLALCSARQTSLSLSLSF